MRLVEKVAALLTWRQKVRTGLLVVLTVLTAAMETLGIASVTPFLAVLAAPSSVETNPFLSRAHSFLSNESQEQFLLILGLLAFLGLVSSTGFRALNSWGQLRFSRSVGYALACRLMTSYLRRPYVFFLSRNNADLTKMVLGEVTQVVAGFLVPSMAIISSVITATFLLTLICLASNPLLALGATATVGGIYVAIYFSMRRWLGRLGEARFKANQECFEAASEIFGGIKEIKLLGNEDVYLKRFSGALSRVALAQTTASLAGGLPVYALELVAVGGGLLAALYYFVRSGVELSVALPIIALYILCARRVLPAAQSIFKSVSQLRYSDKPVKQVLDDFYQTEPQANEAPASTARPMPFRHALLLDDVSFSYPKATKTAIAKLKLEIPMGARVGFVGATGSGKTTTIDLILGLLSPTTGQLLVDGIPIGQENIRPWQANLGYVPQHIYLADDTVAANIAFGVPPKKFDQGAVERAARLAGIHDFVSTEMEAGYMTLVGERGVRLSGGQRQRIGVARALYRDPKVLLFDEATSALDNLTEKAVMQELWGLGRDRTLIFIAHRLTTVRDCDVIYLFAGGKINACGSYQELMANSADFRSLAMHDS